MNNHTFEEFLKNRKVLMETALGIDWDQQSASRYYIGEDEAQAILARLGFPWENGISNEAVDKFITELNQKNLEEFEMMGS